MTDNKETIEMLKMLKEQALKSHNDTAVLEVKIDSFKFVLDEAIKALEQQTCEDAVSRQALKRKLQEHHDLFINAYGGRVGFKSMADDKEKARVDEINNCIAMVVNEPSVIPKEKSEYDHDREVVKAYNDGQAYILDKIKAEVEAKCCITVGRENDGAITLYDIFEIIDKYRESEDKE